jgi:lysophospholipase L1-like esterase
VRPPLWVCAACVAACALLWPGPAVGAGIGTWLKTGPLLAGVENPTLTVLPSGQALLAGGARAGGSSSAETHSITTAAELYDPSQGKWSATGAMAVPRLLHTATLLESGADAGEVLVTGGEDSPSQSVASAELYDPTTGAWSPTGSMATERAGHTATLLPSGKVLVVGGNFGKGPAAELYDPSTGSFSPTEAMPVDPSFHTATLLERGADAGDVLITGGIASASGGYTQTAAAELYDPSTDTWSQTGSLLTARDLATATLLPSGEVLIAGGYNAELGTLASAELYDQTTGTFSATTPMSLGRWEPTATLLDAGTNRGEVLLVGGDLGAVTEAGPRASAAEVYDPVLGNWTATGPVVFPRLEHKTALLSSGQVLVAGGDLGTPANSLSSAELFTPAGVSPGATEGAHGRVARRTAHAQGRRLRAERVGLSRRARHSPIAKRMSLDRHARDSPIAKRMSLDRHARDSPIAKRMGLGRHAKRSKRGLTAKRTDGHKRSRSHRTTHRSPSRKTRRSRSHKARKPARKHSKSASRTTAPVDLRTLPGPQGPPGSQGPAGLAGSAGSTGSQGPAGPPSLEAQKGGVLIQIGDSLTAFGFDYAENAADSASTGDLGAISPDNWGMWAALDSQGRIRYGGAAATAGYTSAQILEATQKLLATPPARPIAYATVLAGSNDIGYELPLATSQANLTAIYELLVAHGITPILCTLPPRNGAEFGQPPETIVRQRNATIALNQWIAHTAQVNGWPLVDLYAALVDPETGEYKPGLNTDFLHQNSTGAQVMGAALASALTGYQLSPSPQLADTQADPLYGVGNNLFLNSTGGLPEDWEAAGAPTLEVAPDPAVEGNAFSITRDGSEYGEAWTSTPMPAQPGDVVYLAGKIQSSVQAAGGAIYYRLISYPSHSTAVFGLYDWNRDILGSGQWGTFAIETTVPNLGSDDALQLQAIVKGPAGTQLKLAQVTLLNMTQSGVLP